MRTLALLSIIAIAACSKKEQPPPPPQPQPTPTAGTGSAAPVASVDAALVIPPYTPSADVAAAVKAAVTAEDRIPEDRALDAGRKPGEVMTFFKIAPGQKIGELFAG